MNCNSSESQNLRDSFSGTNVNCSKDNKEVVQNSCSDIDTYEQEFNEKLVEQNKQELNLKEKLKEEKGIIGSIDSIHSNPIRKPNLEKNIQKTSRNHSLTVSLSNAESGDYHIKCNWKKNEWPEMCGDSCMTDTEKIRLEQIMSEFPIEVSSGGVAHVKMEPFCESIYDTGTRKRLDEINEELRKLRTTRCLDPIASNERTFEVKNLEELSEEIGEILEATPIGNKSVA